MRKPLHEVITNVVDFFRNKDMTIQLKRNVIYCPNTRRAFIGCAVFFRKNFMGLRHLQNILQKYFHVLCNINTALPLLKITGKDFPV